LVEFVGEALDRSLHVGDVVFVGVELCLRGLALILRLDVLGLNLP
jgi:hypothetical protein